MGAEDNIGHLEEEARKRKERLEALKGKQQQKTNESSSEGTSALPK